MQITVQTLTFAYNIITFNIQYIQFNYKFSPYIIMDNYGFDLTDLYCL